MDLLQGMLQRDQTEFVRISNRLLSHCFICRSHTPSRSDYYFILKHRDMFADYLSVLGYRLEINEEYGVVQLTNPQNYNRLNLRLYESIILLILRILYDEKKRELSMTDEVIITLGEVHDTFLTLKIRDKMIDKTTLRNAMSLFRRFQLVELLDRDLSDENARVILYDSILMAVRVEDIQQAYDKLEKYRKGVETDEEIDENEAD